MKTKGVNVVIAGHAKGLDQQVETLARKLGFDVHSNPAKWERYGRAAGPIRNKEMLDELLTYEEKYVHAFHDNLEESKGTKNMITQAEKQNLVVTLHSIPSKPLKRKFSI
jgi:hypothetical protein